MEIPVTVMFQVTEIVLSNYFATLCQIIQKFGMLPSDNESEVNGHFCCSN